MSRDARSGRVRVKLGYGSAHVDFAYDPERFEMLSPRDEAAAELDDRALAGALQQGIGGEGLTDIVEAGDRVLVVVPDATRASGSARVCRMLVSALNEMDVPDARITMLVGAGTHRAPTPDEIDRIVGPEVARRVGIEVHDAFDASQHTLVGTTTRGTPVEIDRRLLDTDVLVLVGAIGLHYFAGFSGGRKAVLPACASDRAIQANHLLGFDRATLERAAGVASGRLDGNPVSEDMDEAAAMVGPDYLVNTVVDVGNRITAVYGGDWLVAHRLGCEEYLEAHTVRAGGKRPLIVASCGGAPRDGNMSQSHKALEQARGGLAVGGSRVWAERLVENYKIYGQTAGGIRW